MLYLEWRVSYIAFSKNRDNKWDWSAPAGMEGGRQGAEGNACWRNADTRFFFFFSISLSSRDRSAAARVDLTTYGMVGSMTVHMTGLW